MSNTTEFEKKELEETEFEKQKIVYEKASELHRYFASWRQLLFAGFIAVIGLIIFKCCDKSNHLTIAILLFIASIVSLVFYLLDTRNAELFHICQEVESKIEDYWFKKLEDEETITEGNIKLYKRLNLSHQKNKPKPKSARKKITHTRIIATLYIGCSITTFILSILFFFFPSFYNCFK